MAGSPERWGSRIGVILAVAGSAVGLGNFLRFPGQAAQNGGGAFMLPYFISLLVLGIPLCWAEWTMGRYGGLKGFNSAPGIFSAIARTPKARYFGGIALLLPLVIYMYYVLIEAWCLGYAIKYLTGDLVMGGGGDVDAIASGIRAKADGPLSDGEVSSQAFGQFFDGFVGKNADGAIWSGQNVMLLVVLVATFAFNFALIYRGVTKGIEAFCRVAMPVMVMLAIVVLIRVLTLGTPDPAQPDRNVVNGLGAMWNPNSDKLWDPQTWLAASGQIFFSLSVGFGIIINYASYLREQDDVVLSGLTSSSMNEFFEVCLGGLITLPAAFIFLGATAASFGTFGLGFVALPNVFGQMPGGQAFGFLWFFMLFIAAVTSSVSMLQPVIAFLEEGFGLKRHASAAILGLISAIGCLFVMTYSKGLVALDTFDFWVGTLLIYVLAMFQAILYGWIFGIRQGDVEAHKGAHIRIPTFVQWMLKIVVPLYLFGIFIAFCFEKLPSKQEPVFEVSVDQKDAFAGSTIADSLRETFASAGHKVPADAIVVRENDLWILKNNAVELMPIFAVGEGMRKHVLTVSPVGSDSVETSVLDTLAIENALNDGKVNDALKAMLPHPDKLPDDAVVTTTPDAWSIAEKSGTSIAVIRSNPLDAGSPVLVVKKHTAGYVETITLKPIVAASIGFIFTVLTFLLILIHIAGKRWIAEGRFDSLQEPA